MRVQGTRRQEWRVLAASRPRFGGGTPPNVVAGAGRLINRQGDLAENAHTAHIAFITTGTPPCFPPNQQGSVAVAGKAVLARALARVRVLSSALSSHHNKLPFIPSQESFPSPHTCPSLQQLRRRPSRLTDTSSSVPAWLLRAARHLDVPVTSRQKS